jgi:hypothetical protein
VSNRHIAERYAEAIQTRDVEMHRGLMHPEIVVHYPQSGETIRGADNYSDMLAAYPGGLPEGQLSSLRADPKTVVLSPSLPFLQPTVTLYGGDQFVIEARASYPDGELLVVGLFRIRGGSVGEETWYFSSPFAPPDWRRPYVES